MSYGALIAHRCPRNWFPASVLLADDPGVERSLNTRGVSVLIRENQQRGSQFGGLGVRTNPLARGTLPRTAGPALLE